MLFLESYSICSPTFSCETWNLIFFLSSKKTSSMALMSRTLSLYIFLGVLIFLHGLVSSPRNTVWHTTCESRLALSTAVYYSFVLMSSSWLNHFTSVGYLGCFQGWTIMNSAAINIFVQISLLFPRDIIPKVGLSDQRIWTVSWFLLHNPGRIGPIYSATSSNI